MIFNWTPNFVPNKIVIFGCGGTGSRVVPLVAQFVKSCAWVINPELILVDFDAVEEKNLLRQNFISSDVGKNKAVVLASRYSKAFGISILPIIQRLFVSNVKTNLQIEAYQDYDRIIYNNERKNIIYIMCVDSPEARREILHLIITTGGAAINNILIDAGNENDFGQIVVSSLFTMDTPNSDHLRLRTLVNSALSPITVPLKCIPLDLKYYEDMVATSTPSCVALDQTMAINTLMAVNIFAIIQNIYYVKPISYSRINVSMQYGSNPQYINPKYLLEMYEDRPSNSSTYNMLYRVLFSNELAKAVDDVDDFEKEMDRALLKAETAKKKGGEDEESTTEGVAPPEVLTPNIKGKTKPVQDTTLLHTAVTIGSGLASLSDISSIDEIMDQVQSGMSVVGVVGLLPGAVGRSGITEIDSST